MVDFLRAIPQVFGIIAGEPDNPGGGEILSPPVNDNPCNATLLPVYFDCTPTWGDDRRHQFCYTTSLLSGRWIQL